MSGECTIYVREVLLAPYSVRGRHHHGIALGLLYLVGGAYLRILCDGRRGHYLLELGYTEGPADSITLHEGGVIMILLCPASVVLTYGYFIIIARNFL